MNTGNYLIKNENEHYDNRQKLDEYDLRQLRIQRNLDKKLSQALKEIFIYLIFLFFLNVVSNLNASNSSITYKQLFHSTFVDRQAQNEIGLNDVSI